MASGGWLATGCDSSSELEPSAIRSGIYAVVARTTVDTCGLPRPSGELGKVEVKVQANSIAITAKRSGAGSTSGLRSHRFTAEESYIASSTSEIARAAGCAASPSWLFERSLHSTTELGFLVLDRSAFTQPCPAAPALPEQPRADCRFEQELFYDLETVCEAPCQVQWRGGDDLTCACDEVL